MQDTQITPKPNFEQGFFYAGNFLMPRIQPNSYLFYQIVTPENWKYAVGSIYLVNYANNQQSIGFIYSQTFTNGYIELCPFDDHPHKEKYAPVIVPTNEVKEIYRIVGSWQTYP